MLGLFIAWYVQNKMPSMKGTRAAEGVLFFFAMEFLQFFQYFWIADNLKDKKCENFVNKALTLAGFLHICLQVGLPPPACQIFPAIPSLHLNLSLFEFFSRSRTTPTSSTPP